MAWHQDRCQPHLAVTATVAQWRTLKHTCAVALLFTTPALTAIEGNFGRLRQMHFLDGEGEGEISPGVSCCLRAFHVAAAPFSSTLAMLKRPVMLFH